MNPRKIVIGDIHGALAALWQLLGRIELQKNDLLIFLGDYVDGWSQSSGLIEFLISLGKTQSCLFIKGNHDAWCERWLQGKWPELDWLYHGGITTIESYERCSPQQKMKHLSFFGRMKYYHIDEGNRLFIHAGFTSPKGPGMEKDERTLYWDRTLLDMALRAEKKTKKKPIVYPKKLQLFSEIYIGHTPTLNYDTQVPMQVCNIWDLDTGAGFTGRLSGMDIETKTVWQSDPVQTLYPGETGRNR